MATAWANPSHWYSPSTKQGDLGSPPASGGEQWPESPVESSDELVPIHCTSPDSAARFQEMVRLASEKALLERRFSEHQRSAEIARANAMERETALKEMANEAATAVNTAIVLERQRATDATRELEISLAQVQEELKRERHAREALSSRELKLHEAVAASAAESALLRAELCSMESNSDAMRHAMSQTKEKALRSVAFRLTNRATSQAFSSWVDMWQKATAVRARFLGIFSRWHHRELAQGWFSWLEWWQACAAKRTRLRRMMTQWINQSMTLCWRSWACMAAERSEALRKLRQGAMKLLQRRLAMGFARWQSTCRDGSRQRDSLFRRALGRLAHRGLSRAWQAWRTDARRAKAKSASAVKNKLHLAMNRIQALERQVEAAASEMERQRSYHTRELREKGREVGELAERLAKAKRIAERERLHRADLDRDLVRAGIRVTLRSPLGRSSPRSPRSPRG